MACRMWRTYSCVPIDAALSSQRAVTSTPASTSSSALYLNLGEWRAHFCERLARQVDVTGDVELAALLEEIVSYRAAVDERGARSLASARIGLGFCCPASRQLRCARRLSMPSSRRSRPSS